MVTLPILPHQTVHAIFPHTAFRCSSLQGMRLLPNRCCRHLVKPIPLVQRPVFKPDVSRLPISDLVPLAQMSYQPLLHMVPYLAHCFAAIAIVKVADPAA